jgi:tyrosyl-tRNA synthetase
MASSPPAMTLTKKFNLIVRNLEEHYGDDLMMKILPERDLKLYWGTYREMWHWLLLAMTV